jgi:tetraacyldisaccharide 4'-kinase
VTAPAALGYRLAVARRNRGFDRGRGIERLGVRVISVGNLTAGGVGKTPMVRWIVERLRREGHHPLIGMRGYGARAGEVGDEEAEYRRLLPGVAVVAHPRRAEAIGAALRTRQDVDVVVLDDGFQHRQLHRDLDIVLVDGRADTLADRPLPLGWLREPTTALRRADAVVVTHMRAADDDLAAAIERVHGRPPIAWCDHAWDGFERHDGGTSDESASHDEPVPTTWIAGRRIVTLLGIGRPERVRQRLDALGASVVADLPARDHQVYDQRTVRSLAVSVADAGGAEAVVMTGKDWVKMERMLASDPLPVPILVPRLGLEFAEGQLALGALIDPPVS